MLQLESFLFSRFGRSLDEDLSSLAVAILRGFTAIAQILAPCASGRCHPEEVVDPFDEKFRVVGVGANGMAFNDDENRARVGLVTVISPHGHSPGGQPPALIEIDRGLEKER